MSRDSHGASGEDPRTLRGYRTRGEAEAASGGELLVCDAGPAVHPQFWLKRPWRVGEPVSKGLNGDTYPCGHIASISASLRVIRTTTGLVFYRKRETAYWRANQTWTLVAGHIHTQNPDF